MDDEKVKKKSGKKGKKKMSRKNQKNPQSISKKEKKLRKRERCAASSSGRPFSNGALFGREGSGPSRAEEARIVVRRRGGRGGEEGKGEVGDH